MGEPRRDANQYIACHPVFDTPLCVPHDTCLPRLHLMLAAKVGWLSRRSSSPRARAALTRRSSRCRSVLRPPATGRGGGRSGAQLVQQQLSR